MHRCIIIISWACHKSADILESLRTSLFASISTFLTAKGPPKKPEGQQEGQKDRVTTANQWTVRLSLQGTMNNNRRTWGIVTWPQREYGKVVGEVSVSTY